MTSVRAARDRVGVALALTVALGAGPAVPAPGDGGAGSGPGAGPTEGAAPGTVAPSRIAPAPRDTVFPVSRGTRLVLENLRGEVLVGTWDQPRVRIDPGRDEPRFRIEDGEELVVRPLDRHDRGRRHDYRVTVPAWIALAVQGRSLDVVVDGVVGGVDVHTVSGDVTIRRAAGGIQARSVEGELVVEDSRGPIQLRSLGDDVRVVRSSGTIQVEATDGDLHLLELDAGAVQARTMDGDIEFSGRIREGGRYSLSTHDGDLSVGVVGALAARVSVATFDGSFESDFPVVTDHYRSGRELRFTVGGGGAELALSAFDGDIRLRRHR